MKITIESTNTVTKIDGVPVRLWEGKTESGTPCKVFTHRLAVARAEDCSQFERELQEMSSPGQFIELRHTL
jgi:hypothetical protein